MLTIAEKVLLRGYVNRIKTEYKSFMGVGSLPAMELETMTIDEMMSGLANAEMLYDPSSDKYTFRVFERIYDPAVASDCEYIIYHELTHALDISRYGARDRDKYNQLRGYLEYHASQIELMKMLGAVEFSQHITFSMDDKIRDTNGEVSVLEFIESGLNATAEIMAKPDFRHSLLRVFHAVGTLYNHLGRISICRMYAKDFDAHSTSLEKRCPGTRLLGADNWDCACKIFSGIMSDALIDLGGKLYYGSLIRLFKSLGITC